ncbi:MAG: acyl-CoA dehydrogenase, partial [Alphaproteobacteria bacterium]|nr:acyl-CoA dehydrogenase [Alphaproteobacteria bacterium]
ETGAAQYYRDARIAPIYEGTNGIQAIDLVTRKLLRDEGEAALEYIEELHALINGMNPRSEVDIAIIRQHFAASVDALDNATQWLLDAGRESAVDALAGASHYLRLFGIVAGGAMLARAALHCAEVLEAGAEDGARFTDKMTVARFYAEQILPQAAGLATTVATGGATTMALAEDRF